eukprot:1188779-Pyramimonas_sp.AAC.1
MVDLAHSSTSWNESAVEKHRAISWPPPQTARAPPLGHEERAGPGDPAGRIHLGDDQITKPR